MVETGVHGGVGHGDKRSGEKWHNVVDAETYGAIRMSLLLQKSCPGFVVWTERSYDIITPSLSFKRQAVIVCSTDEA